MSRDPSPMHPCPPSACARHARARARNWLQQRADGGVCGGRACGGRCTQWGFNSHSGGTTQSEQGK
eukprot:4389595-Prymnesium_polylepis.1